MVATICNCCKRQIGNGLYVAASAYWPADEEGIEMLVDVCQECDQGGRTAEVFERATAERRKPVALYARKESE